MSDCNNGSCDCWSQSSRSYKMSDNICFACRGELSGIPRVLKAGFLYEKCSPLVQAETKHDPLEPMTAPDQCIVAFVGNCAIDAREWEEDCKAPVYDEVVVYKQRVNWPCDETGEQLFSLDDLEMIYQGHTCCIRFIDLKDCPTAPQWLIDQNATSKGKAA